MDTPTLEHRVLGPGNLVENVPRFERMDSIADIQARRAGTPLDQLEPEISPEDMQKQWYYGRNAAAYSIRGGNHVLELYDLNNEENFPDKSKFVQTLRREGNYFSKLPDLENKARVIKLSDKKFNKFVTKDNDDYSHIAFNISDVIKGKDHFKRTYGIEATKLFTAVHGEDVYSKEGIKGRFRENLETTNVYFVNQEITTAKLSEKEKGTKLLRGACLGRLGFVSVVNLVYRFLVDDAHVSGVVEKSGAAGDAKNMLPYEQAERLLKPLVAPPLHRQLTAKLDKIYCRK